MTVTIKLILTDTKLTKQINNFELIFFYFPFGFGKKQMGRILPSSSGNIFDRYLNSVIGDIV